MTSVDTAPEIDVRLRNFVLQSDHIEGLIPKPDQLEREMQAHTDILEADQVTVDALVDFVKVCQQNAVLRSEPGVNVVVGNHRPPAGGPEIVERLETLLQRMANGELDAYEAHCKYEDLHPFTDGNGRSGRVLWLRMMGGVRAVPRGFLHEWYYQSLQHYR